MGSGCPHSRQGPSSDPHPKPRTGMGSQKRVRKPPRQQTTDPPHASSACDTGQTRATVQAREKTPSLGPISRARLARGQAASTAPAVSEASPGNEAPRGGPPEPPRARTHFLQPVFPLFYSFFLFSGKPHAQCGVDPMTPRPDARSLRSPAARAVSVLTTQYSLWACVPQAPGGPKLCHVGHACWQGSKHQGTRWRRKDREDRPSCLPAPTPPSRPD